MSPGDPEGIQRENPWGALFDPFWNSKGITRFPITPFLGISGIPVIVSSPSLFGNNWDTLARYHSFLETMVLFGLPIIPCLATIEPQ